MALEQTGLRELVSQEIIEDSLDLSLEVGRKRTTALLGFLERDQGGREADANAPVLPNECVDLSVTRPVEIARPGPAPLLDFEVLVQVAAECA
jgi:hypothetical protein